MDPKQELPQAQPELQQKLGVMQGLLQLVPQEERRSLVGCSLTAVILGAAEVDLTYTNYGNEFKLK